MYNSTGPAEIEPLNDNITVPTASNREDRNELKLVIIWDRKQGRSLFFSTFYTFFFEVETPQNQNQVTLPRKSCFIVRRPNKKNPVSDHDIRVSDRLSSSCGQDEQKSPLRCEAKEIQKLRPLAHDFFCKRTREWQAK
jgi:hypothetical protein